jgi:hypothetical protein
MPLVGPCVTPRFCSMSVDGSSSGMLWPIRCLVSCCLWWDWNMLYVMILYVVLYVDNHWTFCIFCIYLDLLHTRSQHQQVPWFPEVNAYQGGDLSVLWLLGCWSEAIIVCLMSLMHNSSEQVFQCLTLSFCIVPECRTVLLTHLQGWNVKRFSLGCIPCREACVKNLEGKGSSRIVRQRSNLWPCWVHH